MDPNTKLFEMYAPQAAKGRVLAINLEDDRFFSDLAAEVEQLTLYPRYVSLTQQLQRRLKNRANITVEEGFYPNTEGAFDSALLALPKGRNLARAVLMKALMALRPGGRLFVTGANKGGAKTMQKELEAVAPVGVLGTKARYRLFTMTRPETLNFPAEWGSPWEMETRQFTIRDQAYTIHTMPGVFSYDHLDEGSELLIEQFTSMEVPAGARILDAGCGYGILAYTALRELQPGQVVAVDDDWLAVQCARATLPPEVEVRGGDITQMSFDDPFDLILCNPPFHAEHEKDVRFMQSFAPHAATLLSREGQLYVVANAFLPYAELLQSNFAQASLFNGDDKFSVWVARIAAKKLRLADRRRRDIVEEVNPDNFFEALYILHEAYQQGDLSFDQMANRLEISRSELRRTLEELGLSDDAK